MIRDFFVNTTILISFIFIAGQVCRCGNNPRDSQLKPKILGGIIYGLLGTTLLFFSIRVTPITMLDSRHLPIIIASITGGYVSTLISTGIICAVRLIFFEYSFSSLAGVIYVLIIAIVCIIISKTMTSNLKKWFYMSAFSIVTVLITAAFVLSKQSSGYPKVNIMLYFGLTLTIASFFTYYTSEYIQRTNMLFNSLKEQSTTDFLTGLNNVRQFDRLINNTFTDLEHGDTRLSVLIIDIDHFKNVNDTYGHAGGDAILKELGDILKRSCRAMDSASRMGGEEFSILMPDCGHEQAIEAAERIRLIVQKHSFVLPCSTKINITVSIGAATYPDTIQSTAELLRQADDALYKAKRTGRNKVCSIDRCRSNQAFWEEL